MSRIPDLELEPDGDFADDLEQLLLAEMGFDADVIERSRSASPTVSPTRVRRYVAVMAAGLVAASVVGLLLVDRDRSGPKPPVVLDVPTTVPRMSGVSTTTAASTPTSTTPSSTSPSDVAVPTTLAALPPGMPVAEPLAAGTTYRLGRAVLGRSVRITNPVEGGWGQWDRGGFVLTSPDDHAQVLIAAADMSKGRVFDDPLIDTSTLGDVLGLTAATGEPPEDYLAFFATLPGVEVGAITDTEFAGQPARAMSWTFGAFEGGTPCATGPHCVVTVWFPGTRDDGGWISRYTAGDTGTLYVLDLDDRTVIVDVRARPDATAAAASMVIGD